MSHAKDSQLPESWESGGKMCSLGLFSFLNGLGLPTLVTCEVVFYAVLNRSEGHPLALELAIWA